jgi:hypothetical protein
MRLTNQKLCFSDIIVELQARGPVATGGESADVDPGRQKLGRAPCSCMTFDRVLRRKWMNDAEA